MKLFIQAIAFLVAISPILGFAEDFTVEDGGLTTLPKSIETAIQGSKGFEYPSCKLIGKPVNLSGQDANSGFIATTADACDWGVAQGPIWIVINQAQPVTVLEYGGYSLVLGKQSKNGLRNVEISAATAGHSSESLWKFDGAHYVKVKEKTRINH